ncbi:unnamed protein product [Pleuronectes platessa]|uniref:Uncharacterized protein n=1 Tax=Pleuronectes platessa TaxID=8262 RepID=A0A9N7U995_PLEPL|nr:unnamed protein product [Pleuronectes platessa]
MEGATATWVEGWGEAGVKDDKNRGGETGMWRGRAITASRHQGRRGMEGEGGKISQTLSPASPPSIHPSFTTTRACLIHLSPPSLGLFYPALFSMHCYVAYGCRCFGYSTAFIFSSSLPLPSLCKGSAHIGFISTKERATVPPPVPRLDIGPVPSFQITQAELRSLHPFILPSQCFFFPVTQNRGAKRRVREREERTDDDRRAEQEDERHEGQLMNCTELESSQIPLNNPLALPLHHPPVPPSSPSLAPSVMLLTLEEGIRQSSLASLLCLSAAMLSAHRARDRLKGGEGGGGGGGVVVVEEKGGGETCAGEYSSLSDSHHALINSACRNAQTPPERV